jgi:hypothetical protein
MRIILGIFALSMFLTCQEETSSGFRQCGRMTISDALPVQFWLSECDTFNEHEAGGVHHVCWCQPWNCEDLITLQFQDEAGQTFTLLAYDEEGLLVMFKSIPEIQSGVYQISFTPNDEEICDELIKLQVVNDTAYSIIAPSLWTDDPNAVSPFDTKNSTQFIEAVTSTTGQNGAYQAAVVPVGATVTIPLTITISGTWVSGAGIDISMYLGDSSGGVVSEQLSPATTFTANGTYNIEITLRGLTQTSARIYLLLTEFVTSGTANVTITMPVGYVFYAPDSSIVLKSDCLDVAESHDETIFIEYSNHRNYAGLIYANDSPDTTFGIRVPCRFVHEVEPEEDEAMELTSSIITTSAQVKTQRLLEVKHGPYYWHKKLRRVLKHQTLTIFDKQWKKEEKYEVIEGKGTWPLKAATCLLTEKTSVVRNVL